MFKFKSVSTLALLAASSISLGACASGPGNLNGIGKDAGPMLVFHKNADYGPPTQHDYAVAMAHAQSCLRDVHTQQAGLSEVMVTNSALDAAAVAGGTVGQVATQASMLAEHLIPGADAALAGGGAVYGAVTGAVNGLKIKSNAVTNIVGNCTNGDLHDALTGRQAPGVHVYGSSVRTNNSARPGFYPSWVVPDSQAHSGLPAANNNVAEQQNDTN